MTPTGPDPALSEANAVLVLHRPAEDGAYLIAALQEDPEDKHKPYKISLTRVPQVPPGLEALVVTECPAHLHRSRPVHVVVSAKSGTGLAAQVWESAVRPLLELLQGMDGVGTAGYEMHGTQSENTIKELARDLGGDPGAPPTLVLLSGDGGMSDLLNARDPDAPPPTVVILPLGTGNALFHSLHKPLYTPYGPSPLVHGLRTFWKGSPSPLPVFSARFPPGSTLVRPGQEPAAWQGVEGILGAVVFSHGFHASLVWESDTPRYRAHGAARFGMVAAALLAESHAYEVEISVRGPGEGDFRPLGRVDGEVEGELGYVLVAMVSNMERTFTISPGSRPLDGMMRVVHFGAVGGRRTMEIMRAAYDEGKHVGMGDVGYEEVEGLEVSVLGEDARWRKVCVDGTIVDVPQGGKVCVERVGSPVNVLIQ